VERRKKKEKKREEEKRSSTEAKVSFFFPVCFGPLLIQNFRLPRQIVNLSNEESLMDNEVVPDIRIRYNQIKEKKESIRCKLYNFFLQ